MKKAIITGLICSFAFTAQAQDRDWYVGFEGSGLSTDTGVRIDGVSDEFDSDPGGINLKLGRELNQRYAVEALVGLGTREDSVEGLGVDVDMELDQLYGVSALVNFNPAERFSVYGKLGVVRIKYESDIDVSAKATGFLLGAGARLHLSERLGLNFEYVKYPDADIRGPGNISGVNYKWSEVKADAFNIGGYIKF